MPNIALFLERGDVSDFFHALSIDPEVAFLVEVGSEALSGGAKHWRACKELSPARDGSISVWHMPSGPVVVKNEKIRGPDYLQVEAPFEGWSSPAYTNNQSLPLLGNKPQFFEFHVEVDSRSSPQLPGLSSISWVGSRYEKAPAEAKRFWQRLQRLSKSRARSVRGDGISSDSESQFLCWPSAYERIVAFDSSRI